MPPVASGVAAGIAEFFAALPGLDPVFEARRTSLAAQGKVLRHVALLEATATGYRSRVGLEAVGREHPLFPIRGGENAVVFLTEHYSPTPLLVRGYGAGGEVTAAGALADVLRIVT